ncbi:DNA repair protein RadC [uncultured Roseburia sp.]|uniref:DNA repair protein RadC n=1 Tax=Brotonthovivens ammoniilytica TaxID=2981725 RepID=A0ABT2TGC3_9FIRM|nr:DNA repair protein RadC [Brotonthovivens ammoniilytica]MCU6761220.1 DNA repair protein RadC [Brotonthovivens ammoniilytica]SCI22309.1 DNA repair protein RadC [uncultured Roseburia sp.]
MQKNISMKELPDSEKPYERCLKDGAESLTDAELIAVVIRTGSRQEKAVALAQRILKVSPGGILNLEYLTAKNLQNIHGIGKVKAVQLKCVAEISKRIAATRRAESVIMQDASTIAAYYMERLRHKEQEHLILAMYDSKCMFLKDIVLSVGTCNASLISPREIFVKALTYQAVYVVLVHNHPSGNPEASREDYAVTNRIKECGKLLGVPLLDHIIIGDNRYFSFQEQDIL